MAQILDLTKMLGIPSGAVLNRANISGGFRKIIYEICEKYDVKIASEWLIIVCLAAIDVDRRVFGC